jgi:hypothetical protein
MNTVLWEVTIHTLLVMDVSEERMAVFYNVEDQPKGTKEQQVIKKQ